MATLLIALFDDPETAHAATGSLLLEGVPPERITVSIPLTADGIAAEVPGQSFENQNRSDSTVAAREEARINEAIRAAVVCLTVRTGLGMDSERLQVLLRALGARGIHRTRYAQA